MKTLCCLLLGLLTVPVLAQFDSTCTFTKGLDGCTKTGDVIWEKSGYVCLGSKLTNTDNCLTYKWVAPDCGKYVVCFDYRFKGVDCALVDDKVDCKAVDTTTTTVWSEKSSCDLTKGKTWQSCISQEFTAKKGECCKICFDHKESKLGGLRLVTCLDIDNICIKKCTPDGDHVVVPAPAAIVLGIFGTGLVGWLRRRNVL